MQNLILTSSEHGRQGAVIRVTLIASLLLPALIAVHFGQLIMFGAIWDIDWEDQGHGTPMAGFIWGSMMVMSGCCWIAAAERCWKRRYLATVILILLSTPFLFCVVQHYVQPRG